jgi:uncharacterized protein YdiU (UPF0061 family)
VDEASEIVHAMPGQIEAARRTHFGAKLGLSAPGTEDDALIEDLLGLMQKDGADFTNTFDALARGDARDQFLDREGFDAWAARWRARLASSDDPQALMRAANPRIIPRNHRIEAMIEAAVAGDYAPFERLMAALARPYDTEDLELMRPPVAAERVAATFCGT